ncbi:hypothetical protein G6F57_022695 [Rhizopus arrhizus]|nr:hypothetical protein G6F57_022695 [Rhizopus arrhizus]
MLATVSARIANTVLPLQTAEKNRPSAPNSAGSATCQRRSRRRSELREIRIMPITANRLGIAVKRPIANGLCTPVLLIRLGIQNPTPYRPITNEK